MPRIRFDVNPRKALESILYVMSKREKINMYNLLKIVFEADKFHLNSYGRPVTGDTFIKMQYGTVPSLIKDFLNQEPMGLSALQMDEYPFQRKGYFLQNTRAPEMKYLSDSDIEALDHGIAEYADLTFKEVETKNHQEKCWIEGEMNRQIPFESMIEEKEVLEYLQGSGLRVVV